MLLNFGTGKDYWESLGLQEIQPVNPKGNQSWNANILATLYKELIHWKRFWCWERLKVGGKWDDRGGDGWIVSLSWWTWVWVSPGSWLMDREAWRAAVHGVTNSWTRLSDWTEVRPTGWPTLIWRKSSYLWAGWLHIKKKNPLQLAKRWSG